jgi:long-chain acyl-CoA synthetase
MFNPRTPDGVASEKPALIDGHCGTVVTHGALAVRATRAAAWLADLGLEAGDGIAMLLENRVELLELALAARAAGLYYTPISTHLTPSEVAYILRDCGARLFVCSQAMLANLSGADGADLPESVRKVLVDGAQAGWADYAHALASVAPDAARDAQLAERPLGRDLLYSSGTTGRPKGVKRPLAARNPGQPDAEVENWRRGFGFDASSIYLSPAPLYHAAPLRYTMRVIEIGATAVVMPKFDAEQALALITRHRVTHSQWVPTMFTRMLKLPEAVRQRYDLSSLRVAVHAAAPCPVPLKQAMLDWWGDVLHEYYAGSEGVGITMIDSPDWRAHPGSVGRAVGCGLHIVDDEGHELPPGEVGTIYFSGMPGASYLNDPQKTQAMYNAQGWATYGDMGHVDSSGYLYLSDRRADLILSGGVNVYPQEIENTLALHPAVDDVAVVGVPDDDLGEVPKAVVQLRADLVPDAAQAAELLAFCARTLARTKLPRSVLFEERIPRLDNGKLLRRVLKERLRATPQAGFAWRPN